MYPIRNSNSILIYRIGRLIFADLKTIVGNVQQMCLRYGNQLTKLNSIILYHKNQCRQGVMLLDANQPVSFQFGY